MKRKSANCAIQAKSSLLVVERQAIVAKRKDRLSESEIGYFVDKAEVPEALVREIVDASYGDKQPLFRRTSGLATLTIFDGGHELIAPAAIAWIEAMDPKN